MLESLLIGRRRSSYYLIESYSSVRYLPFSKNLQYTAKRFFQYFCIILPLIMIIQIYFRKFNFFKYHNYTVGQLFVLKSTGRLTSPNLLSTTQLRLCSAETYLCKSTKSLLLCFVWISHNSWSNILVLNNRNKNVNDTIVFGNISVELVSN